MDKKQMTEEDIKRMYITPAIQAKWQNDKFTMETNITDGKINIQGNKVTRETRKRADYILYINDGNPIAIVEAKDNNHSVSFGLQQAKEYAQMMDIKFAYSSNGDAFEEFDFITGQEREIALDEFPSPEELYARYKAEKAVTPKEEKLFNQPYYSGTNTNSPRYYQRVAINRTLEAISKEQKRIFLVMATGTGKTYTAFQIVYRLLKSGFKQKILYLADRNNLVDQSIQQDFQPLEKIIHKIDFKKDLKAGINAYQVYFSLYHQLVGNKTDSEIENDEDDESAEETLAHYKQLFAPDYFDLIIVDECHRGSAKENSRWRAILEYFEGATQIGMTATPKETDTVSNIDYFGEPLYSYSLKQGIDDGFLAPFRVYNIKTNISDEWRPFKGQLDINGYEIEDRIYNNTDYDYKIIIQDRIDAVAEEITNYLKETDRMAKTIVFCATEDAAERMRVALVKKNADKVAENPDYIVRITGGDDYGKSKLGYFISVNEPYPVIATTSKLLSTGTDCKMVKLIVIDQNINSMGEFKQIIGRGTRIREKEGKTHFAIMDFRGVSRLFADPNWDGPVEQLDSYHKVNMPEPGGEGGVLVDPPGPKAPNYKPIVDSHGCEVRIENKIVSVYDTDGKLLRQEDIISYTKTNIKDTYVSLKHFIDTWTSEEKKVKIKELLGEKGINLDDLKQDQGMEDVDDFDFICHIAYDQKPLTRKERAENVKKRNIFAKYGKDVQDVLNTLLESYAENGIYDLETTEILKLKPFEKFGKPSRIVGFFGGRDKYFEAIKELEETLYEVAI